MPIKKIPGISLDLFKKRNLNSLSLLYCTTQSSSRFSGGLWSSNCSGNPQTDSSKHWLTDLNHPRRRPSCSLVSCGWCSYRAGEVVVVVEEAIGEGHTPWSVNLFSFSCNFCERDSNYTRTCGNIWRLFMEYSVSSVFCEKNIKPNCINESM